MTIVYNTLCQINAFAEITPNISHKNCFAQKYLYSSVITEKLKFWGILRNAFSTMNYFLIHTL